MKLSISIDSIPSGKVRLTFKIPEMKKPFTLDVTLEQAEQALLLIKSAAHSKDFHFSMQA